MKPLTETEIRRSIVNASQGEAKRMPLPGLHEVMWDHREYLGWRDPGAPQRGYLVFWRDDKPVGFVLRAAEKTRRLGAAMCSLCQMSQPADQVTLFTAPRAGEAGRAGNTVGTYICADLGCSTLIRMAPANYGGGLYDAHVDRDVLIASRIAGLEERVQSFAARVLTV